MIHLFFAHDSWFDVIHDSFTFLHFFSRDSWFKIPLPPPKELMTQYEYIGLKTKH